MFKKIIKGIFFICGFFATIGGAYSFYQALSIGNDYDLVLYLKDSEKIIENNKKTLGLSMLFNGAEIDSLYLSKIQLQNSGKRALTKDFIYEPLTIEIGSTNKILQTNPPIPFVTHTENTITIKWDLLNPDEAIKLSLFTTEPIEVKTNYKIKEITNINFVNEVANPPTDKRLKSISSIWFFLIIYSIAITLDALLLIIKDLKLSSVIGFVKSLPAKGSIDKKEFLTELSTLYGDYYRSMHWLFVTPEALIAHVSKGLNSTEMISGKELEVICKDTLDMVMHGNLYTIRSRSIFIGPFLFCICIIAITIFLFA